MHEKQFAGTAAGRPSEILVAFSQKARRIRKLLARLRRAKANGAWGRLDDAERLAWAIERLCSRPETLSAAKATATVELVEVMIDQLAELTAQILASAVGV